MSIWDDKRNLTCFEPLQYERPWTLETYARIGGYDAWKKILAEKTPREKIIDQVKASGLRGRGGAAFPSPFKFAPHGQSGIEVSEVFPRLAEHVDEMTIIRSMQTAVPSHETSRTAATANPAGR